MDQDPEGVDQARVARAARDHCRISMCLRAIRDARKLGYERSVSQQLMLRRQQHLAIGITLVRMILFRDARRT